MNSGQKNLNSINLNNIAIVLHKPRYPENIGAAARALCNMGIKRLLVVDPENYDIDKVRKLATHTASDIIENIEIHQTLSRALADFTYVAGTTARLGGQRRMINSPSMLAEKLAPISADNLIAILFGPEDRGLSNEDIRNCHLLVNIPTSDFSSLNLAQAVMIICYEIFTYACVEKKDFTPRFANRHELEGMYAHLKDILIKISYINTENPDYWMNKLRYFFNRLPLRAGEVSIIRGICRQIEWYGKRKKY
ncbi:tRNA/rRNA methyltransferase [Desulfosarcina sp. BuS5]|uniref:RNA methyltransferase n=1 Tax=Desulfosarcina sp. BuS5 TaxID=933262 RepID=UPI000484BE9A|nr:RNA methyltransferase [Desulfosarcina sp. BuS5]WDN90658.1 tRNA/rRNA methyltransferase [Desulfosarcina sp. BuS5]